ncbi:hypothetical protein HNP52_003115 [Sphingomonas kyeonggiensis]|uniref:Uncharacterized protein n=1 Tax=Sphingomonas kyeonggiensis TaxID=1268553 RepID=A0A7W7K2Z2_9SPHN|nr:hypothetical protein [Sphingomonas kyeonggiensis]MBB4840023.1 hypothetical protein [Sphingomonas kyeonggiensis]
MAEIRCLVCPHVLAGTRPVRVMIHHWDGDWQAVCGEWDHSPANDDFDVICISHLFDRQPDLGGLRMLAPEHIAERVDDEWQVSPFDEEAPD